MSAAREWASWALSQVKARRAAKRARAKLIADALERDRKIKAEIDAMRSSEDLVILSGSQPDKARRCPNGFVEDSGSEEDDARRRRAKLQPAWSVRCVDCGLAKTIRPGQALRSINEPRQELELRGWVSRGSGRWARNYRCPGCSERAA